MFSERVSVQPPPILRAVKTIAIIQQPGVEVLRFARKAPAAVLYCLGKGCGSVARFCDLIGPQPLISEGIVVKAGSDILTSTGKSAPEWESQ